MKSPNTVNILFCGMGGQGVLTAAEVCGWAALSEGLEVKKSEVHGMAQRGGSVESHLRFGREVFSPLIPEGEADYLVPFERNEGERLRYFLKKAGVDLTHDLEDAQKVLKDRRALNVFLLGRLSRHLSIREKNWEIALKKVFASKKLEENIKVFFQGRGGVR